MGWAGVTRDSLDSGLSPPSPGGEDMLSPWSEDATGAWGGGGRGGRAGGRREGRSRDGESNDQGDDNDLFKVSSVRGMSSVKTLRGDYWTASLNKQRVRIREYF